MAKRKDIKFEIPDGSPISSCRGCNGMIYFVPQPSGSRMPVDPDGTPHWATCKNAGEFRRKKEKK